MKNAPAVLKPTLAQRIAERFSVDPAQLMATLKATAFRQAKGGEIGDAQMTALMIVADQYGLNPFTKELYAYPDKQGGIVPVVSVDGWTRIINSNPALNGIEFSYAEDTETPKHGKECPVWIECAIARKDRDGPIRVREYLDECYRPPFIRDDGTAVNGPWQTHTKRLLRHKTLIQCSRIAFGFAGIYDEDEAQRILERDITPQVEILIEGPKSKNGATSNAGNTQPGAAGDAGAVTPASSTAGTNSSLPAPAAASPFISADQAIHLEDRCKEAGIKVAAFCAAAKVGRISQLPADDYARALAWIEKREARK